MKSHCLVASFQINFKYEANDEESTDSNWEPATWRVAMTRSTVVPVRLLFVLSRITLLLLATIRNAQWVQFRAFLFAVLMIWLALFLALAGYHVYLVWTKEVRWLQMNDILEDAVNAYDATDDTITTKSILLFRTWFRLYKKSSHCYPAVFRRTLVRFSEISALYHRREFGSHGLFPSRTFLAFRVWNKTLSTYGHPSNQRFKICSFSAKLWGVVQSWQMIIPLKIAHLFSTGRMCADQHEQEPIGPDGVPLWRFVSLSKPLGDTCAIESFTQYFRGNIDYLNEKKLEITTSRMYGFSRYLLTLVSAAFEQEPFVW